MPVRKSRRYLRIWVRGAQGFASKEVSDAIQKGVLSLYGFHGLSLLEPTLIEFEESEQIGILRCNRSHLREMRASLAFIVNMGDSSAAIHVARASGTIKSLRSHRDDFLGRVEASEK
jgi:ribonuclease P/MRP protein subunit POP5